MLVLSRQRDETIMIGDDIEITIVDIRGDKVRLGITAPTRIAVHRKEVYEAIRAENQQAARMRHTELDRLSATLSAGPAKRRPSAASKLSGGVARPAEDVPPPGVTTPPPHTPDAAAASPERRTA